MRRIFRETTAIALTLSLGLPPAAFAQQVDAAAAAAAAESGGVVVLPGGAPASAQDAPAVGDKAADPDAEALKKALRTQEKAAEKAKAKADKAKQKADKAEQKADKADAKARTRADRAAETAADPAQGTAVDQAAAEAAAEADQAAVQRLEAASQEREARKKARDAARKAEQTAAEVTRADDKPEPVVPRASRSNAQGGARADTAQPMDASAADAGAAVIVLPKSGADPKAVAKPKVVVPTAPPAVVAQPLDPVVAAERDALAAALQDAAVIPEKAAKKTDAAVEAAKAEAAPAAAALAQDAKPVVVSGKTEVTRDNSRDATEDFATDLSGAARNPGRGALSQGARPVVVGTADGTADSSSGVVVVGDGKGADPDAAAAAAAARNGVVVVDPNGSTDKGSTRSADKDDDSDLEQALKGVVLPALAGLVVGQVLSNNRQVALNTGDRVVLTRADGSQEVLKDDNALLLRPGSTVQTDEFADGSSRTIVTREDGSQVVTIRDANLRVLRRSVVRPDGTTTALIDETAAVRPVDVASLPAPAEPVVVLPGDQASEEALREALRRETTVGRSFTLGQIRAIPQVRALVAPVDIQAITFDTGSAAIKPDQAQALASLGRVIVEQIRQNPGEVFLIEGHTDTVGKDAMNLALSDRRAESVALALSEFFQVPPENMVVQGYGEQFLKIAQDGDVRANRRAAVRRITDLLARN